MEGDVLVPGVVLVVVIECVIFEIRPVIVVECIDVVVIVAVVVVPSMESSIVAVKEDVGDGMVVHQRELAKSRHSGMKCVDVWMWEVGGWKTRSENG